MPILAIGGQRKARTLSTSLRRRRGHHDSEHTGKEKWERSHGENVYVFKRKKSIEGGQPGDEEGRGGGNEGASRSCILKHI